MRWLGALIIFFGLLWACQGSAQQAPQSEKKVEYEVEKTKAEWKGELTPQQYYVMQAGGTERPYSSPLLREDDKGELHCAACGNLLFDNEDQYDAKCGWPSFDRVVKGAVTYEDDYKLGYRRTEVLCAKCGSHLGHVFNDGPQKTTGMRYCINGVALDFRPKEDVNQ